MLRWLGRTFATWRTIAAASSSNACLLITASSRHAVQNKGPIPMAVAVPDITAVVVERIQAAYPRSALFSVAETDDWPDGTLDHLLECGILQHADRAEAVACPGCIWQCHKPIVVRTVE